MVSRRDDARSTEDPEAACDGARATLMVRHARLAAGVLIVWSHACHVPLTLGELERGPPSLHCTSLRGAARCISPELPWHVHVSACLWIAHMAAPFSRSEANKRRHERSLCVI
mmetsp:Transcript_11527/g.29527  ORF Transcript_11527/g.29527 Transcript_11527/m.29527 type:complete len:113 (+) Transcript_11527:885-1223(+)